MIEKDYDVHMILDNLPVARKYSSPDGKIVSLKISKFTGQNSTFLGSPCLNF